jgi:hypothetical protein
VVFRFCLKEGATASLSELSWIGKEPLEARMCFPVPGGRNWDVPFDLPRTEEEEAAELTVSWPKGTERDATW